MWSLLVNVVMVVIVVGVPVGIARYLTWVLYELPNEE